MEEPEGEGESKESEDAASKIASALLAGKKIEAIKICREEMGLGLKEAKDYVEKLIRDLNAENPGSIPEPKGCASMVAIGLLSASTIAWGLVEIVS